MILTKHSASKLTALGLSVKSCSPPTPQLLLQDQHLPRLSTYTAVGNLTQLSSIPYCHILHCLKVILSKGCGFFLINMVLISPVRADEGCEFQSMLKGWNPRQKRQEHITHLTKEKGRPGWHYLADQNCDLCESWLNSLLCFYHVLKTKSRFWTRRGETS